MGAKEDGVIPFLTLLCISYYIRSFGQSEIDPVKANQEILNVMVLQNIPINIANVNIFSKNNSQGTSSDNPVKISLVI